MKGKVVGAFILIAALLISGVWGIRWINYRLTHAISNAAFVESDSMLNLAYKRVGGRIERLFKEEGEQVNKGEVLAKLEDRELRVKLQQIEHQIRALKKEQEALIIERRKLRKELSSRRTIARQNISRVRSKLEALETALNQLDRDWKRFKELFGKGVVPARKFEEIDTQREKLLKEKEALESLLASSVEEERIVKNSFKALEVLDKRIEALGERIRAMEKQAKDLRDMIEETVLRAPFDGYVVKRFVKEGEVVRQGQYIYSLLNPDDLYILVLLEETKLEGVRVGSKVEIKVDALPGEKFSGRVSVINMATASKFALIPRDITAGEFTKVAQRIPVKVEITEGKKELLRVGLGAEVAIEKSR